MTAKIAKLEPRSEQTLAFQGVPPLLQEHLRGHFCEFYPGFDLMGRIRVGDVVRMRSNDGRHDYGRGAVSGLFCGVLKDMLGEFFDEHHSRPEEPDELLATLAQHHGKEAVRRGETWTVVFLVRLRDD